MPDTSAAQAETLQRFIAAWKKWDASVSLAVFADDFTQVTLPTSLGAPSRSRAEVEVTLPALVATIKSFELVVHHVVHEPQKNMAVVSASSTGVAPWGEFRMEYAVFATFTEAGDKIAKLEEMLDSAAVHEFGPKFVQYLEANGGPVAVAAAAHD